jgi:hypothetical protein
VRIERENADLTGAWQTEETTREVGKLISNPPDRPFRAYICDFKSATSGAAFNFAINPLTETRIVAENQVIDIARVRRFDEAHE